MFLAMNYIFHEFEVKRRLGLQCTHCQDLVTSMDPYLYSLPWQHQFSNQDMIVISHLHKREHCVPPTAWNHPQSIRDSHVEFKLDRLK